MKKMLALVLSLVMVFGLVGCGKNAGGSDNDGSTKLTVWYWGEQEIPGYKQYMEEMAQKYSSETDGISVEVVLQESDTLYSALRTAEQAGEVCEGIRAIIRKLYGAHVARSVTIQYGGSMNAKNAAELLSQPDVDGGLIGGAALKPADFVEIINAADQE